MRSDKLQEFVEISRKIENELQSETQLRTQLQAKLREADLRVQRLAAQDSKKIQDLKNEKNALKSDLVHLEGRYQKAVADTQSQVSHLTEELDHYKKTWQAMQEREALSANLAQDNEALNRKLSESAERSRYFEEALEQEKKKYYELELHVRQLKTTIDRAFTSFSSHFKTLDEITRQLQEQMSVRGQAEITLRDQIRQNQESFEKRQTEVLQQMIWIKKKIADFSTQLDAQASETQTRVDLTTQALMERIQKLESRLNDPEADRKARIEQLKELLTTLEIDDPRREEIKTQMGALLDAPPSRALAKNDPRFYPVEMGL